MRGRLPFAPLFAALLLLAVSCDAAPPPPAIPLAGRVTDAADLLDAAQEARLTNILAALEQDTKHQFVVVTTPSLKGQAVETFSIDLARAWGIGRKNYNDGLVLLVAPNERKARIEVGRGLEKQLPDALCERIMTGEIIPHFAEGDMSGGIAAGVAALDRELRRPSALPPER